MESIIGPKLPVSRSENSSSSETSGNAGEEIIGPVLAEKPTPLPTSFYGPAIPPDLLNKKVESPKIGPIGPILPPGFSLSNTSKTASTLEENSDDDYCIGPCIGEFDTGEKEEKVTVVADIEKRSKKMKARLLNVEKAINKREDWMTQLPEFLGTKIGLGARSFKKQADASGSGSQDRSSWTDSPSEKLKKEAMGIDEEEKGPSTQELATFRRNEELSNKLEEFNNTKRQDSLLDIHKKKRKRKAEKDAEKGNQRRAFDRDKDLDARRVDASFAKGMVDKAKLTGRFSHGSSHFL